MPAFLLPRARSPGDEQVAERTLVGHSSGPDAVLKTVCRLARAQTAQLLESDRWDGSVQVIASTAGGAPKTLSAPFAKAMLDEAARSSASWHFRWCREADEGGASLLLKITDRVSSSVVLILGYPDDDMAGRATAERIAPDLVALTRVFVELDGRARDLERRYDAAVAALDDGECGMIAVRSDHTVVFANAAASLMLAANDGLQMVRGVLRPTHHADLTRLQAAIDAVTAPNPIERLKTRKAFVMMLMAKGKRRPKIVAVTPADQSGLSAEDETAARALIYVLEPRAQEPTGMAALCRLHGMSRVEARLACYLCEGLTVHEAAAEMRIKPETARAYLKQAFTKTDTHRQAELVTLLTRYVRAMRGSYDFQAA